MCLCYGAAAATSEQFISFLPRVEISYRRGKSDGCWGVVSTRNVRNTRSAVKVECFGCRTLYTLLSLPSSSLLDVLLPRPYLLWIQILNNAHQFTIDTTCPFELVTRARSNARVNRSVASSWKREETTIPRGRWKGFLEITLVKLTGSWP